jgi:hypothetical protein
MQIFRWAILLILGACMGMQAQAQCSPTPYVKRQTDLAEATYKSDKYDDFDQVDIALVNDQTYSKAHELDNRNDYMICVFTDPGIKAMALQINDNNGRKIEMINTITSVEKHLVKYYFEPPYQGRYTIEVKIITADNVAHCVRVLILERDPYKA